jgi:hypothetical protein
LVRIRQSHRHARHDGYRRQDWPAPWPTRFDAQRQDRNGNLRCGQDGSGTQSR